MTGVNSARPETIVRKTSIGQAFFGVACIQSISACGSLRLAASRTLMSSSW